MRFLGAVAIFVIGLVASAVGLVDQLQNRPLDLISVTQDLQTPTTYVVIPNRVLSAYPGQVTVSAKMTATKVQIFAGLRRWLNGGACAKRLCFGSVSAHLPALNDGSTYTGA